MEETKENQGDKEAQNQLWSNVPQQSQENVCMMSSIS